MVREALVGRNVYGAGGHRIEALRPCVPPVLGGVVVDERGAALREGDVFRLGEVRLVYERMPETEEVTPLIVDRTE